MTSQAFISCVPWSAIRDIVLHILANRGWFLTCMVRSAVMVLAARYFLDGAKNSEIKKMIRYYPPDR